MIESKNNEEKKGEIESSKNHPNNASLENNIINMHKQCRCCFETIHISAKVCQHCGRYQNFWLRHFGDTAIIVSIVMVIIAAVQLLGAFKEQINASNALKIAENAAKDSQKALVQITSDANEISSLKNRIEFQSAKVDLFAQKATEAIDQLKFIACTNAKATITDLMAANFGFEDGLNLKARLELHDRIINSLKQIGVSEDDIEAVGSMWHKGVGVIYFRGIGCALEGRTNPNMINTNASPELLRASEEFQKLLNFENWEAPSPDEIESFIKGKGFMNDKVKELIEDYRLFLKTGEIRRREVFEKL